MLESFTSQMFYGGTTYGTMRGPVGWMYGALRRAHIQPEIVYDETILRDGLKAFEVLVAPHCGVLSEGVVSAIQAWQDKGGILIADENLCPRLMPAILIEKCVSGDKSELIKTAQRLREELAAIYTSYGDADTSEAILRFRRFGSTDYLFVFNDHRTFGNYVGQYGRVMEQGLPLEATLTVRRPGGVIYDLLAGKAVPTREAGGVLQFAANFHPGEGRLYMITERPIATVSITGEKQAQRSQSITFTIAVTDTSGAVLDAVVPLRIDILDPQGQPSEFSGFHAAKAGRLTLTLDLAPNDTVGQWHLQVQELASGKSASMTTWISE